MRMWKSRPRTLFPVISVCAWDFIQVHVCLTSEACHTWTHKHSVCVCGCVSEYEWFRAYLKACTDSFTVLACANVCTVRLQSSSTRLDYGIRARDILYLLCLPYLSFLISVCYTFNPALDFKNMSVKTKFVLWFTQEGRYQNYVSNQIKTLYLYIL